jgi:hypothetical protein
MPDKAYPFCFKVNHQMSYHTQPNDSHPPDHAHAPVNWLGYLMMQTFFQ